MSKSLFRFLIYSWLLINAGLAQNPSFEFKQSTADPQVHMLTLQWDPGYGMVLERSRDLQTWEQMDWHYSFGEEVAYELFRVLKADDEPTPVDPNAPPKAYPQYIYKDIADGSGLLVSWPREDQEAPGQAFLSGLTLPEAGVSSPIYGKTLKTSQMTWNFTMIYQGKLEIRPSISYTPTSDEQAALNALRQVWPQIRSDFENRSTASSNYKPDTRTDATGQQYFYRVTRQILDSDRDGISDHIELSGDNPSDPFDSDTDGDGLFDGQENDLGTNPNGHADETDSDGDGLVDGEDADPGDPAVCWLKAPESEYVVVPLGEPFPATSHYTEYRDFGADGRVLATYYSHDGHFAKVWSPDTNSWSDLPLKTAEFLVIPSGRILTQPALGSSMHFDSSGNLYGSAVARIIDHNPYRNGNTVVTVAVKYNFNGTGYTGPTLVGSSLGGMIGGGLPDNRNSWIYVMRGAPKLTAGGASSFLLDEEDGFVHFHTESPPNWTLQLHPSNVRLESGSVDLGRGVSYGCAGYRNPIYAHSIGAESGWLAYSITENYYSGEYRHKAIRVPKLGEAQAPKIQLTVPASSNQLISAIAGIKPELIPIADPENPPQTPPEILIWSGNAARGNNGHTYIYSNGTWTRSSRTGDKRLRGKINARGECLIDSETLLRNANPIPLNNLVDPSQYSNLQGIDINDSGMILATCETPTGGRTPILLLPVEVVELAPKLRDLTTNEEIDGSEVPDVREDRTNPMIEVNPTQNRIAHREIKIRIGNGNALEGKKVTWSMTPLFTPPAGGDPVFRGDWADSQNHSDRFETSAVYGAHGFERVSQQQGRTEIDAEGFTAIRANLPPIGFNKARISIEIEDVDDAIELIDMEVPAIVVIDPGHGGTQTAAGSSWNNATSPSGVREKDMTLAYGRALRDSIEAHATQNNQQIRVRMTRNSDINLSGQRRANIARDVGADVFHSFHFNAANGTARGSESLIRGSANVNEDEDEALGRRVLDGVLAAIRQHDADGARDRGVKNYAWSASQGQNVPSGWAVLSDTSYANVGGANPYHPIRGIISEVEFIDVQAVDVLLNTGPNAANVRTSVANEVRDAIIEDINHQP